MASAPVPPELDFEAGCRALVPHVRHAPWPVKFRPHLPEKFDGSIDLHEFLQIYSTTIIAAGGANDVMANYFHMALTGAARTWLMNLPEGSVPSWEALCWLFLANFAGSCPRAGSEADLHAVRQQPNETLRQFVQRFCQVRHTIPQIAPASVIVAFRQGVRDEKMLEKLATREIHDVGDLLALTDKCARAAEGWAWHNPRAVQPGLTNKTPEQDGHKTTEPGAVYAETNPVTYAAATTGTPELPRNGERVRCGAHSMTPTVTT